jgi:hypothetical protein
MGVGLLVGVVLYYAPDNINKGPGCAIPEYFECVTTPATGELRAIVPPCGLLYMLTEQAPDSRLALAR